MSNVRDYGRKIKSLKNMQKVTRAMNMISSIKLRKYLMHQASADKFLEQTERIRREVVFNLDESHHPAVKGFKSIEKAHIIIITSDKGLCGTHNSSVLKAVDSFVRKLQKKGIAAEFTCLGIKAGNHAKREGWEVIRREEMNERAMTKETLKSISDEAYERFLSQTVQQVWVFGKIFRSTLQQDNEQKLLLPFSSDGSAAAKNDGGKSANEGCVVLQTEPAGDALAETFGRTYINDVLRGLLLHSYLSEHSSRLTAMENATRNSDDLVGKYATLQNHARQAAITNELIEIVSGKEALKG